MHTLTAEIVLSDCYYAIRKHNLLLQGEDFRLSWWNIISLLRAVGHVLETVDSKISNTHKNVICNEYKMLKASKPEPQIYWNFIVEERNSFLKNYEHNISRELTGLVDEKTNSSLISVYTHQLLNARIKPLNTDSLSLSKIKNGPFMGKTEVDVALEACDWWSDYINKLKCQIYGVLDK